jgi:hypothetical protein
MPVIQEGCGPSARKVINNILWSIKDDLALRTLDIYNALYESLGKYPSLKCTEIS